MLIYRISKSEFIDDLTGVGAKLFGGRWNSKGIFMLYASANRALAVLELLVHLDANEIQQHNFSIAEIEIPETSLKIVPLNSLPDNWRHPNTTQYLKSRGDVWIRKSESVALAVPSVLIPQEQNILVNSQHPDFRKVKLKKTYEFSLDRRLKQ